MHKCRCRPIQDLKFSPRRKSELSKQYLQQGNCQAQPIKVRPYIFTLKVMTRHPRSTAKNEILLCYRPHLTLLPLKVINIWLTPSPTRPLRLTDPPILAIKIFSADVYTMEIKMPTCLMVSTNGRIIHSVNLHDLSSRLTSNAKHKILIRT